MKTLFDHIETIKAQPHHVRERVALGAAGACAAVVALVWFFGVFATGTFAIQDTTFAQSTGAEASAVATVAQQDTNYGVAGAAAALPSDTSVPAHIQIVDAPPASGLPQGSLSAPAAPSATVIPF